MLSKTKPKVIFCDGLDLPKLQNSLHTFYPIVCTLNNHLKDNDIQEVISIEDLLKDESDGESHDLFW